MSEVDREPEGEPSLAENLPDEGSGVSGSTAPPRRWSDEEKVWIVQESLVPGSTVAEVAELYGVSPRLLSTWRKLVRKGKLAVAPAPGDDEPAFAAVEVEAPSGPAFLGSVSIEVRGVTVRLDGDVSAARITAIASALRGLR